MIPKFNCYSEVGDFVTQTFNEFFSEDLNNFLIQNHIKSVFTYEDFENDAVSMFYFIEKNFNRKDYIYFYKQIDLDCSIKFYFILKNSLEKVYFLHIDNFSNLEIATELFEEIKNHMVLK